MEAIKIKNRLKILRAERNLTQLDLAKLCGISRVALNAIERDRANPKDTTIETLSIVLQVAKEQIFPANKTA